MVSLQYKNTLSLSQISFLKQTYLLFALSLLSATIGCLIGLDNFQFVKNWLFGFLLLEILFIFAIIFFQEKHGLNYLILFSFTFLTGLTTAPLIQETLEISGGSEIVFNAFILSLAVFSSLTIYAMTTKKDFSIYGQLLFTSLIVLVCSSILGIFFNNNTYDLIISGFTVILFSFFVIHDTQSILNDEIETPVLAAIKLYLDFANIFVSLVTLLSGKKD